jgi:pyruvate dehydrogenase E1 component alpha subunit
MNLAAVWNLPVLFVCKNNEWAITTRSADVTRGGLLERAQGLGLVSKKVEGISVEEVWQKAGESITHLRSGNRPVFLLTRCVHLDGHFLGDPLIRLSQHPIKEGGKMAGPIIKALMKKKGASISEKTTALKDIGQLTSKVLRKQKIKEQDPLFLTRQKLSVDKERLLNLENEVSLEIKKIFTTVENEPSLQGGRV